METLSIESALKLILSKIEAQCQSETISADCALGRVAAEEITARRMLPPFDNSAMDGYAVKVGDSGQKVKVIGTIYAGDAPSDALARGEAIRIMTGAPIPKGTEAVVMREQIVSAGDEAITLPNQITPNQHIRYAGEEVQEGAQLIGRGECVSPIDAALLASQGITKVNVYKRLNVAVIASGDEVVEPWQTPDRYQIFNTNAVAIMQTLAKAGFEARYVGLCGDDPIVLATMIKKALLENDALIITGGVSAGAADHTRRAFETIGAEVFFHGLNFKPGKPTMAGKALDKLFFALPGNPLSAIANLLMLALPSLRKLQGAQKIFNDFCAAKNVRTFAIKGDRDIALLGTLAGGQWQITQGGKYGSGMLLPIARSNSFAIFAPRAGDIEAGIKIKVVPIDGTFSATFRDPLNR
ncbi:MAG: molybdopterin molybdotransferase MoeA [Helicobacteraceae bacterium]|jgi:molybdopterin molybdotransferase|nr:molybdopterin molybdotransferase MoeA [Helicobacteraceae bacterium]